MENDSTLNPDHEKKYDASQTKISDSESGPRKRRHRPFCDNLREYLENTSLHGFRYILDERSTWVERWWWVCMVITSMTVCSFFIWKVWDQWDKTPVIVSFADTSNSAWTIPFPAVTVCTETKPRQRIFNFTKAHEKYKNSTISLEDSKTYYDMLLLCNNPNSNGPTYADASSFETIRKLAPSLDDVFLKCIWKDFECSNLFYHTLTKDGYCFTFNMLSEEQLFKTENLHKDYSHVGTKNHSSWSLEKGYSNPPKVNTYPLRGPSYGGVEFEIILATDKRDMDLLCRGPVQGFKVWLHSPAELPNMGQNFFRLPIQFQSAASITPNVIKTSDGLKNYSPDKRRCYFPDEKYLRFFRTYTQRNCELECASNFTAMMCGCVPLYMPHGPETEVCGGGMQLCIIKAWERHSLDKSSLTLKKDDVSTKESQCGCLQACLELSYGAEVSQAVYNITNYNELGNYFDSDIANGWRVPSGLVLYFGSEQFTSLRRSELYGGVSFLANCGGILGLFMGFSFLSLAEIFYYFTIRLWRRVLESRKTSEEEK